MLCDFYGKGQNYQENLLTKYYTKKGHQVTIIACTIESAFDYVNDKYNKHIPKSTVELDGGKVIRLPYALNFLNKLRRFSGVYNVLLQEKPDLIFVHDIHFNINDAVKYVKNNTHCKLILDYHADYTNSAKNWISLNILHKVIRKSYFNLYKKYFSKIYPIVPESAKFLYEVYNVPYAEMELLPLGCDYDISKQVIEGSDKVALKKEFNIQNNDVVLITGGKFHVLKRTEILIAAVKKLNLPNIHLIIFGTSDENHRDYEKELKESAIGYNIHFTGWVSNYKSLELMSISDVAIFPSSQSVLWQQSIGMHLPLIVGDLGRQDASYLNKNDNVIIVETHNINADYFAKTIGELVSNPDQLNKMKMGAKKTVQEFLDYNIIVDKTLENL